MKIRREKVKLVVAFTKKTCRVAAFVMKLILGWLRNVQWQNYYPWTWYQLSEQACLAYQLSVIELVSYRKSGAFHGHGI